MRISRLSMKPPKKPATAPTSVPSGDRDRRRDDADRHRDPAAPEEAREDVVAERVGADRVRRTTNTPGARDEVDGVDPWPRVEAQPTVGQQENAKTTMPTTSPGGDGGIAARHYSRASAAP